MNVNIDLIRNYLGADETIDLPDPKDVQAAIKQANEDTAAIKQALALLADKAEADRELQEAQRVLAEATTDPREQELHQLTANPPGFFSSKRKIREWEQRVAALGGRA